MGGSGSRFDTPPVPLEKRSLINARGKEKEVSPVSA